MRHLILSSAALLALAACAPSPSPATTMETADAGGRQCFRPSLVRNFRAPDDQTLYVRSSRSDVFQIDATFCRDMSSALSIALEPVLGGGGTLCVNDQAILRTSATGAPPCRVTIAKKLTAEEIDALPSRDRP